MTTTDATVEALYRYPVKGLSPESLDEVRLEKDGIFPWDRAFALENGTMDFDPTAPRHFPKIKFLMLMRHETLAGLKTRFDEASMTLHISRNGAELMRADLSNPQGRSALETFMHDFMGPLAKGRPHLAHAPDFSHSDCPARLVSIINLASVAELATRLARPVDPLRFRANVYVEGLAPWQDHEWVGREFSIGSVGMIGHKLTERCAATNVDPVSARRDMDIPKTLLQTYGHSDLGLYAKVKTPGTIRPGDHIVF